MQSKECQLADWTAHRANCSAFPESVAVRSGQVSPLMGQTTDQIERMLMLLQMAWAVGQVFLHWLRCYIELTCSLVG